MSWVDKFLCNFLGWHKAGKASFDGCSFEGRCPRCNRKVLLDSQGNWFAIGEDIKEKSE